ncbi:MAG: transposase family protein [Acholeplasmataceae bacterium]|jgi:transposase InsO family protein|nr:transposase family protein [Acholeplasmataceae bacterium]
MNDNLLNNINYRHSILKYANRFGVTKASYNFNVSRSFIYKLKNRYDGSIDSLKPYSRKPHSHPNMQSKDEIDMIRNYLRRTPNISLVVLWVRLKRAGYTRSITTVYRTLIKLGLKTNPPSKPKKVRREYDKTTFPGQRIQIDIKYVPDECIIDNPNGHKYYQYTAIDEFSRYRVLKIYKEKSTYTSTLFLRYCIRKFPFDIKCVQTDNGMEFTNRFISDKQSLFELELNKLSIAHKLIKPYTPWHNGKVERSHRKDNNYFYTKTYINENDLTKSLTKYVREYNNFPIRPLGWLSPIEYIDKYTKGELDI